MLCDRQSSRSSHGSLPHIESPETIGFQFQGSGNVQCIESAYAKRCNMPNRQSFTYSECRRWLIG